MLVTAFKTGNIGAGHLSVVRAWLTNQDKQDLTYYNRLVDLMNRGKLSAEEFKDTIATDLSSTMSNTAKAAIQAANGGTVALDKLGGSLIGWRLKHKPLMRLSVLPLSVLSPSPFQVQ